MRKWEYFLKFIFPKKLYAFSTKVRVPQALIDFRKFLAAKFILGKSGSVIDGGAHVGYYTRYFSEIIGKKGTVYSFEPNPYIFHLLHKYTSCRNNIIAHQKAISDKNAESSFYVEPYSLCEDSMLGNCRKGQKKIKVKTVCIDDCICSSNDIKLIKLDVEGHELQAIRGAKKIIKSCNPWIIFEYVQNKKRYDKEVVLLLQQLGYRCIDLETLKYLPNTSTIDLTDVLAFPEKDEEKATKLIDSISCFS